MRKPTPVSAADVAGAWLKQRFTSCLDDEAEIFRKNCERVLAGEAPVDDWCVGDLRSSPSDFSAQWALYLLAAYALKHGRDVPEPSTPAGALAEFAASFDEGSAARVVLRDAARILGADCEVCKGFSEAQHAEFGRASEYALCLREALVQEVEQRPVKSGNDVARVQELVNAPEFLFSVVLCCLNLESLSKKLYLHRLEHHALAAHYRRLFGLGGFCSVQ